MEFIRVKNLINGEWVEEKDCDYAPLFNPSTGEQIGEVPLTGPETCERAIDTAHEAFKSWRSMSIAKRMGYIFALREAMDRRTEELAESIAVDQAKHISEARGEVRRVIEILEDACSIPTLIQGETLDNIATNINGRVVRQPLGVFGGVAPFNFPALVFGWFIPYAIGTGNTFIYKPSTQSPLFMQKMGEIFMEIGLPAGVVNIVHGNREVPGTWYENSKIAGVCLVGSTPTAKKMAEACGRNAKRSMLLGGAKNYLVVMEDADMDNFVDNFINSCYGSAGQRCLAGAVVAVVPEVYDEVVERCAKAARELPYGDAMDPDVYMGPVISRAAVNRINEYIQIGVDRGAKLVVDGRNPELPEKNKEGYFVAPTLFADTTPCNPIASEEIFGPVAAVMKIADMDDALELIRKSEFGNGACIFTQSLHYTEKFIREVDTGMVGVNVGICAPHPYLPFGGIKGSHLGTDKVQGKDGIDFFTQNKVATIRTVPPASERAAAKKDKSVRSCVAS